LLLEEIKRVAVNVARADNAPQDPEVVVGDSFVPSTFNDPAWNDRLRRLFTIALGGDAKVHVVERKSGGGEDFGQFPRVLGIPGVMFDLGAQPQALIEKLGPQGVPSLHSDTFAPDARATLASGIELTALAILEGLLSAPLAP
jgi:metal-dependent amidase/aminoacylase/carboxypeptidase family protein